MTTVRVKMRSFRSDLADMINRVRFNNSRVTVMRHGEPAAVLVSLAEVEELDRLRSVYASVPLERLSA